MASRRHRSSRSNSTILYTNAVYYPNFAVYSGNTPAKLNYSCISLVYYAFARVTEAGHIVLGDEYVDANIPCDGARGAIGSLLHLKQQHPHLQVILSVGGSEAGPTYASVAASPVRRDNFARSALGLIEASGLDGIDVNWAYPTDPEQAANFLELLAVVRMTFGGPDGYYLTASLPGSVDMLEIFDLAQIAACVDLVNLAAYDFYGPWSARCGHHAQLYAVGRDEPSGDQSVQYLMSKGVPSKKILFGIPAYGRSFVGPQATAAGRPFAGIPADTDGTFEYRDLPRPATREHVDKRVVAAQCVGGDGGFVSYDNPDTVRMKAQFCKQKALGGLFYFGAHSDSRDSKRSLIAAGFRTLHGS